MKQLTDSQKKGLLLEFPQDGQPLECNDTYYWATTFQNIVLHHSERLFPDVELALGNNGQCTSALFYKIAGDKNDMVADSLSIRDGVKIPFSQVKALENAVNRMHAIAQRENCSPANAEFLRGFHLPNPLVMPEAWRVSSRQGKLIVLWGYTSNASQATFLPLSAVSQNWKDAADRRSIREMLEPYTSKYWFVIRNILLLLLLILAIVFIVRACCSSCGKESCEKEQDGTEQVETDVAGKGNEALSNHDKGTGQNAAEPPQDASNTTDAAGKEGKANAADAAEADGNRGGQTSGKKQPATKQESDGAQSNGRSTADGKSATADGKSATADGKSATADGKAATADGKSATADGKSAVADGKAATASKDGDSEGETDEELADDKAFAKSVDDSMKRQDDLKKLQKDAEDTEKQLADQEKRQTAEKAAEDKEIQQKTAQICKDEAVPADAKEDYNAAAADTDNEAATEKGIETAEQREKNGKATKDEQQLKKMLKDKKAKRAARTRERRRLEADMDKNNDSLRKKARDEARAERQRARYAAKHKNAPKLPEKLTVCSKCHCQGLDLNLDLVDFKEDDEDCTIVLRVQPSCTEIQNFRIVSFKIGYLFQRDFSYDGATGTLSFRLKKKELRDNRWRMSLSYAAEHSGSLRKGTKVKKLESEKEVVKFTLK